MATKFDANWAGASNKQYGYFSYLIPYSFAEGQDGNYIFCKFVNNEWIPIYIGQGNLNERVKDSIHYDCAVKKGATHVHVHLNSFKKERLAEEQDLLKGYPNVYAPTGCNQKEGR